MTKAVVVFAGVTALMLWNAAAQAQSRFETMLFIAEQIEPGTVPEGQTTYVRPVDVPGLSKGVVTITYTIDGDCALVAAYRVSLGPEATINSKVTINFGQLYFTEAKRENTIDGNRIVQKLIVPGAAGASKVEVACTGAAAACDKTASIVGAMGFQLSKAASLAEYRILATSDTMFERRMKAVEHLRKNYCAGTTRKSAF